MSLLLLMQSFVIFKNCYLSHEGWEQRTSMGHFWGPWALRGFPVRPTSDSGSALWQDARTDPSSKVHVSFHSGDIWSLIQNAAKSSSKQAAWVALSVPTARCNVLTKQVFWILPLKGEGSSLERSTASRWLFQLLWNFVLYTSILFMHVKDSVIIRKQLLPTFPLATQPLIEFYMFFEISKRVLKIQLVLTRFIIKHLNEASF